MAKAKLRLTSSDGRAVNITAKGPQDAYLELPVTPRGNREFNFTTRDEIEEFLGTAVAPEGVFIRKPVIDYPRSGTTLYNGAFSISTYISQGFLQGKLTVLYQFADSIDFSNIVTEIKKTGTDLSFLNNCSNLMQSEIINSGLLGSTATKIKKYYLRVKVFFDNKSSYWSDPVWFTLNSNAYNTPIINNITLDYDPELAKSGINKYSGMITITTNGYSVARGTLPEPEVAIVTITNGWFTKSYRIPYPGREIKLKPDMVLNSGSITSNDNFGVYPGGTFNVSVAYECTDDLGVVVTSPSSGTRQIIFQHVNFVTGPITIVQNAENILTAPTVGIENIYMDYDFYNMLSDGTPYLNGNPDTPDNRLINVMFAVYTSSGAQFVRREVSIPLWTFVSRDPNTEPYRGCLITLNDAQFSISQTYRLVVEIRLLGGNYSIIGKHIEETFQIKGSTITVPMDNLDTIVSRYPNAGGKQFGYFGEVVGEYSAQSNKPNTLMPDVKFRGQLTEGLTYDSLDEVIYNNELYLVRASGLTIPPGYTPVPQDMVKITLDNIKQYYKSALPSYKWLAKQIGLPLKMPFSKKTNGEMIIEDACSQVLNSTEGWIKVHNFAKQILYIAKKPIASNVPYRELRRRFLTGDMTRTIRIGLNYYSVRLLEVGPSDVINEKLVTDSNIDNVNNTQNEKELYRALWRDLFTYQLEDLGLVNENSLTYGNKSVITTTQEQDVYGSINVVTTDTEITTDQYDRNGEIYFYRPVLELVREDKLPFRKSKVLPGALSQGSVTGAWLDYDKWTDTGYYGKVSSNTLFTAQELKQLFNIEGLSALPSSLMYHKFYYHGLVIYIPSEPIGVLPKEEIDTLVNSDLIFGTDTNSCVNYKGSDWIMALPNFSPSLYLNHEPLYRGQTSTVNKVLDNSIISDLINRISNKFESMTDYAFTPKHKRWVLESEVSDTLDQDLNGFYIRDIVMDNFKASHLNVNSFEDALPYVDIGRFGETSIVGKATFQDENEYYKYCKLWPMIITQCLDKKQDLYNPTASTSKPQYTTATTKVTVYDVVKKEVEKEIVVNEPIEKEVTVEYVVEKKTDTGSYKFNEVEKQASDRYGLVIYYAKKTDNCYFTTPLYNKENLNVVNFLNGLGMKFSSKFPSVDSYMLQSIITNGKTTQNIAKPVIINQFFKDSREVKTYLKKLVRQGLNIGSLRNFASNILNTSTDRTKPYGMMYGNISSGYCYFAVPEWYNLYEDHTTGEMNKDPMITVDSVGGLDNTWTKMININNNPLPVPLINTYLPYEDYSIVGKDMLIDKIIPYIVSMEYPNVTVDTIEQIKQEIKDNYIFGVVGVELDTLCVLPNNGILYGDIITPSFLQVPSSHRMQYYFNSTNKVIDLFNPDKKFITELVTETRVEKVLVDNFVSKKYTETVYEEVKVEKTITYPVITYP